MKPMVLCILDGVGIREEVYGNAVKEAKMLTFNSLMKEYPHSLLEASGTSVGLPDGQMGNSEVGHTNIGAGRIVYQPLELINKSIKDKEFFKNEELINAINHAKKNNSKLHLLGLLSDGGVHSHIDHLFALLDLCKQENFTNVYIHAFLDGRDTLPDVALNYLEKLQIKLKKIGFGKIASIIGRYYAMDRDNRWDRVKCAYDTIVNKDNLIDKKISDVLNDSYSNGEYDEFVKPNLFEANGIIEDNDSLIVFNFRPDRLRELFSAITNPNFKEFNVKKFNNLKLVTMMLVSDEVICTNAFKHQELTNTLGDYLAKKGLSQLRIAETEKYAHVTYFFDGGIDKDLKNCQRILIPSPKVATYDLKPEMSAIEVTDKLIEKLNEDIFDVVILNYANGDMVGHTGNFKATVKALETLDDCLKRLFNKIEEKEGTLIIIADHGNSDTMLDSEGRVVTSHSTSLVPFIITNKNLKVKDGKLADIAPTMLSLLNLPIPKEMTGEIIAK
ncbi:MAG: 2,3-bisphosphoglycerate-independent phosphoglycerate mutase [Bacilli bacterium]